MIDPLKAHMRRQALARRNALSAEIPNAGERLKDGLDRLGVGAGRRVAGYWPIGSEIDPRAVMEGALARGAVILLPIVPASAEGAPLEFRRWRVGDTLVRRGFGLMEPLSTAPSDEPDLVLAPLLAFDRRGGRLGYGGGYYDRTLRWLRGSRRIEAVGLAFSGQEVDEVPMGPEDERLDAVLTESGLWAFGADTR